MYLLAIAFLRLRDSIQPLGLERIEFGFRLGALTVNHLVDNSALLKQQNQQVTDERHW